MRKLLSIILLSSCFRITHAQNVGIGTSTPGFPLNFASTLGDKVSLYGNSGNHYGLGVQSALLQIHSDAAGANIAFGYGTSSNFIERMRILNAGTDGMILNGRLLLKNGSLPLDPNQTPGVWLYKADNSGLLGFMGTQNDQNIGFYGGPANGGWGFTYNGINSRIGIGTSNPTSSLNVNGQITVDQKNFGGYGGLLLKGNVPGSNYPNIAFTIKNNAATPADAVAAMIQGDLQNNTAGAETIDLTFLTSNSGLGGLSEKLRIKNNGNVGIGTSNPNAPLGFPPSLGKKITLYPGVTGDAGFGIAGNRLQIYADNPAADVAIGYDAAGTFNEIFAVKPNGALAVNGNTGSAGQVLISNGANASSQWQSPLNSLYKNTWQFYQSSIINVSSSGGGTDLPGLSHTFYVPGNAKILVNLSINTEAPSCAFCGFSRAGVAVYLDDVFAKSFILTLANNSFADVNGSVLLYAGPGTHTVKLKGYSVLGPAVNFWGSNTYSNMIVQVINE